VCTAAQKQLPTHIPLVTVGSDCGQPGMDIWVIGVLVVLLTVLWRVVSSWLESRSTPVPEPYQVGGLTTRSLQLYNGYDFLKPILVAVHGVLYDVTDLRGLYGPGANMPWRRAPNAARAAPHLTVQRHLPTSSTIVETTPAP
jgi:hypothetical protein